MKYHYEVIAGSRKRPQGYIGTYSTRDEARAVALARSYACYVRRVKVSA